MSTTKNISFKNTKIAYTSEGNGPDIIFIHGFLEARSMWAGYLSELKTNYKVTSIDLPGFGDSDCISTYHTMGLMGEAIMAVAEEENIHNFILVGHSLGGYISLALGEKYPEKIKGLILFHSHASADSEDIKTNRDRTIKVIENDGLSFLSNFIVDLFNKENINRLQDKIEELKIVSNKTKAKGITAALAGMRDRSGKISFLADTKIPIGFIIGKQDPRIPLQKIISQTALVKEAHILMLDQVGHMGMHEAPEKCLDFIKYFAKTCQDK
ncbi:MAG: alpha/beta fold hydrolase [Bacteroidales bacterium]